MIAASELVLQPLARGDAAALLAFELENRAHFERWINPREPDFYALAAVQASIAEAEQARTRLSLWRIEAEVRADNVGSSRVLLRNGFREFGRATRAIELAGAWHDLLFYEWHAGAEPRRFEPAD